jgi:hypothetical protein|tara:strand:- start:115 stop:318 length:204 start_codon:yes stop_codon:yes gene_type:complete
MGIHHTYKSQAGERAFKKQSKQLERQQRSRNRQLLKQQQTNNDSYVVPDGVTLTLDMITNPKKNGKI